MTIQTFEKFQVKMLQIGFCLYRADENAKRLVNIDSHFEQTLIAIMYKCVRISIPDWTYINRHYDPNFTTNSSGLNEVMKMLYSM